MQVPEPPLFSLGVAMLPINWCNSATDLLELSIGRADLLLDIFIQFLNGQNQEINIDIGRNFRLYRRWFCDHSKSNIDVCTVMEIFLVWSFEIFVLMPKKYGIWRHESHQKEHIISHKTEHNLKYQTINNSRTACLESLTRD